jgi:general stress protein YciG
MASTNEKTESRGRGFAGMDPERQRQISSQGGKAAHQKGTAHEFDSEEAREAGRKGGMVSGGRRRAREQSARATTEAQPTAPPEAETEVETETEESEAESRTPMGSHEGVGPHA